MEQADHGDLAALLPEDVLADVLRRVAAPRWLARSRCVCKAWRAIIDGESLLRTELPFSGFFITFRELRLPEFFSRPVSPPGRPAISGKLDFLPTPIKVSSDGWSLDGGDYYIQGHCNGLLLLDGYVVNPATRCWNALPLCPHNHTRDGGIVRGILLHDCYLAFDPTVSSHYQVFEIPYLRSGKDETDPLEETSEWPPSSYILHVFSSRRGCWEERLFVRQGDAAGTVAKARVFFEGQQNSVYWRGSIYVHCQSDFVMRISLSEDKYNVIKPPMGVGDTNYIGLSEKGVYFASFVKNHIRVCILNESSNQLEWILKHDYDLKPIQMFDRQVHGPWILEDINYGIFRSHLPNINKEEVIQEKFEWNSDDDDFPENDDMVEVYRRRPYFEIEILGFHPYKEILFLSRSETFKLKAMAFAYHLNSFKIESLGSIYPSCHKYFDSGLANEAREIKSFPYTPCCWIKELPGRVN